MSVVVLLDTEVTQALVVGPTEPVQKNVVLLTHPVFQLLEGVDHRVSLQALDFVVRFQVDLAEGDQTLQAELCGLQPPPSANVTGHLSGFGWGRLIQASVSHPLEMV